MKPDVIAVRDDMTIQEAAAFLVENQISGAPVEDAEGRLIGVVSYADIARVTSELPRQDTPPADTELMGEYFARAGRIRGRPRSSRILPTRFRAHGPRDHDPGALSVAAGAPVGTAARMMLDAHIHRVLVTDGHKVVGILTTSDLLCPVDRVGLNWPLGFVLDFRHSAAPRNDRRKAPSQRLYPPQRRRGHQARRKCAVLRADARACPRRRPRARDHRLLEDQLHRLHGHR